MDLEIDLGRTKERNSGYVSVDFFFRKCTADANIKIPTISIVKHARAQSYIFIQSVMIENNCIPV